MILYNHVDDLLGEFAYAIKSLCDFYDLDPDTLCKIKYSDMIESIITDRTVARHVKSIPFILDIPKQMVPDRATKNVISLNMKPAPGSDEHTGRDGITEYKLQRDNKKPWSKDNTLTFWQWSGFREQYPCGSWVYFIKHKDLKAFYRAILTIHQTTGNAEMPVLPGSMLKEIYENTIKFLEQGRDKKDEYKKARIPYRRGVLLCGPPGCGKTLTCKWLRELCLERGFVTRIVTMEEYRNAMTRGQARSLFRLAKSPGIIFFDDMDIYVKGRNNGTDELKTFLGEMDGIRPTEGVVFVFTTNFVKELDAAFVRPGRIDLYLPFRIPTKALRKRFVEEKFGDDLLKLVVADDVVKRTDEYSFAEIEEIRKLFTMDIINGREVSFDKTFKIFELHRKEFKERCALGFGAQLEGDGDDYYEDETSWEVEQILNS